MAQSFFFTKVLLYKDITETENATYVTKHSLFHRHAGVFACCKNISVSKCKNFEHNIVQNFCRIIRKKTWVFAHSRRLRRRKTLRVL